MSWEIQSKEWLADYVRDIIANELPELPPKEQHFGASTVRWWEGKPGDAVIMAEGGSCDDRSYAEHLCGIQLAQHGYKRAQFTFGVSGDVLDPSGRPVGQDEQQPIPVRLHYRDEVEEGEVLGFRRMSQGSWEVRIRITMIIPNNGPQAGQRLPVDQITNIMKQNIDAGDPRVEVLGNNNLPQLQSFSHLAALRTAGWTDIMAKAKRLIQSGQVTMLRNGANNIVAHVIGDHGEYNCEIGRDDPNSQAISTWQCFLPDAPVTMADGTRYRIDEIKTGDEVLTHRGRGRKVLNQWSRPYQGRMARIKLQGVDEEIVATADHQFWASNDDYYLQNLAGWRGRMKVAGVPLKPTTGWVEAQELEIGHYLSTPQREGEEPCVISEVVIDEEIATFLGWYAAEGYIVASTKNQLGFNLHRDERNVAERLSEIASRFGTPGNIRTMTWPSDPTRMEMVEFRVSNQEIRRLVTEAIGVGSANKKLHPALLIAPERIQRAFLEAYVAGDGYVDGNRTGIHTVSEVMAHQLRILLTRLGHPTSLLFEDNNDGNGFVKNWRRIYRVRWAIGHKRDPTRFMRDGQAWSRIESIEFFDYDGLVYDIEVEEDHSFQVFSINCHNCECPWDQYAWARTRQWKKYEGRPCAHVLAAYWKSKSTPLDDYDPEAHGPMPGQKLHPSDQLLRPKNGEIPEPPEPEGVDMPHPPGALKGPKVPGPPPPLGEPDATGGPAQPPTAPPGAPGVLPPSPMEQLQMQQPPAPGMTPGGMPSPPGSVSIPGAKLPSPFNPIQMPGGTYSSQQFYPQQAVYLKNDVWGQAEGKSEAHGAGQYVEVKARKADGSPQKAEVLGQDPTTQWIEIIVSNDEGKQLEPFLTRCFVEAADIAPSRSNDTGFIRRR